MQISPRDLNRLINIWRCYLCGLPPNQLHFHSTFDVFEGVGQVVLQVAAASPCKMSIGVEKAPMPSQYAKVGTDWLVFTAQIF